MSCTGVPQALTLVCCWNISQLDGCNVATTRDKDDTQTWSKMLNTIFGLGHARG